MKKNIFFILLLSSGILLQGSSANLTELSRAQLTTKMALFEKEIGLLAKQIDLHALTEKTTELSKRSDAHFLSLQQHICDVAAHFKDIKDHFATTEKSLSQIPVALNNELQEQRKNITSLQAALNAFIADNKDLGEQLHLTTLATQEQIDALKTRISSLEGNQKQTRSAQQKRHLLIALGLTTTVAAYVATKYTNVGQNLIAKLPHFGFKATQPISQVITPAAQSA